MTRPAPERNRKDGRGGLSRLRPAELRAYDRFLGHGCPPPSTAVTFTPTAIGTQVALRCECGQAEDITDYDSW